MCETKIFNTFETTRNENETVVEIDFFVEVTKDPDCELDTVFEDESLELLGQKEIKYALEAIGNAQTLAEYGVICIMESCDIKPEVVEVWTKEDWITILLVLGGSLMVIIIFLSIGIHCLRKKYKVGSSIV